MHHLEIARCTVKIKVAPPLRQCRWIVHSVTPYYSLRFRAPADRSQFLRLLAAYVEPAASTGAVDDLAAQLCRYHGSDEAATHLAAHHLNAEYADLLEVTPLEEVDALGSPFLEEATASERMC